VYVVGQDKLPNRIAKNLLLLSARQQWHRNSADTVPAHQSVGHWVRAQNHRYQHLRYEEESIRKKKHSTQHKHPGRGSGLPREGEERERTNISAFAVSFLGFHAAIDQPKGMLQLIKKKRVLKLVNTRSRTLGPKGIMFYARYDRECIRDCAKKKKKESVSGVIIGDGDKSPFYFYVIFYFIFIPLHCETDVDQEVTTATGYEKRRSGRKDDSDLDIYSMPPSGIKKKKRKKKISFDIFFF